MSATRDQRLAAVRAFVAARWDGAYVTRLARDLPGYAEVWETRLHGPDGPRVLTGVDHTGRLEDLTA